MNLLQSPLGDIHFGPVQEGLCQLLEQHRPTSIFFIADENTEKLCVPILKRTGLNGHSIIIPAGEQNKSIESCQLIWSELINLDADRNSLVLNIGGGMISDLGGFAASCYQRGISFANIPTTALSMTDASVGGKVAINFAGLKNYIGLFQTPSFIWIDPVFLQTLPRIELISGLAEIVKHAIIGNKNLWNLLLQVKSVVEISWNKLFVESIPVKLKIVESDLHEHGIRKKLNFGHTVGHAIESHFLESDHSLTHGQSITLGMLAESRMAYQMGMLNSEDFYAIVRLIEELLEPERVPLPTFEILRSIMGKDKKQSKGKLGYSLPDSIGSCQWDVDVKDEIAEESFHWLATQVQGR